MLTTTEKGTEERVSDAIAKFIPPRADVVVLAIGSDRVTGDCIGPLVGYMLSSRGIAVYGGLRSPVTALNIIETCGIIAKRHPHAFIIAVDSAVGTDKEIGKIKVLPRGLRPAAAAGKKLPRVGHLSVIGVVSPERLGAKALAEVRLGSVFSIARAIADGIEEALAAVKTRYGNFGLPFNRI